MRYAEPSIQQMLKVITEEVPDLEELYVVPLYPHFAMSSYETVVDRVKEVAAKNFPELKLTFKEPWYNDADYIKVLGASINEALPDDYHLLFSYHGIPVRHVKKSDCTGQHCFKVKDCCNVASAAHTVCYKHQTMMTTKLLAAELGLEEGTYETSYQSRLGRDPWIQPYTAQRFEELADEGKMKLAVACPAFVSDCLETLEEISEEGKESFLHNGGEQFKPIACLNDRDDWSALLGKWIDEWKA
jgi:ferrochelatase